MSIFKNPAIFRLSSDSEDEDIIAIGGNSESTEAQEMESPNYDVHKTFPSSNDNEDEIIEVKEKSNDLQQGEAGPSEISSRKRLHLMARRSMHTLSESEESDDSVMCLNVDGKQPFSNASLSSLLPLKDNDLAITCAVDNDPVLPQISNKAVDITDELGISKKKKTGVKTRIRGIEKSEKALERQKERERKQQEKLIAKALKDAEKEAKRAAKPGESIKSMKVSVDNQLIEIEDSEAIFSTFLDYEICYSLEKNHVPSSVIWHRRVSDVTLVDNQLQRSERDELENMLFICIPSPLFVNLIYISLQKRKCRCLDEQGLLEYMREIKTIFPKMDITIATVGLHHFVKGRRGNLKRSNEESESGRSSTKSISTKDVDEVIIEVQLQMFFNYKPLIDCVELGHLLARYTKAIAEAPFKKEKYQQQQQFSWYAEADSSCPVKIGKNGEGCSALWQQQIEQFNLVGKDMSQAIAAQFPSPLLLIEAYSKCSTTKEAEKLLKDIVVRRDYGPLGTTRRVGPELSYKMYRFFTSTDEKEFLQR